MRESPTNYALLFIFTLAAARSPLKSQSWCAQEACLVGFVCVQYTAGALAAVACIWKLRL